VVLHSRDSRDVDALLQERVDQLESLSRLANAVARAGSLDDAYAAALDCLALTLSSDRASVLLFDPDGVLRFKAWRGLSDGYREATEGHTPWSPDTRNPRPVLVSDVSEEPSLAELRPVIEGEGIRSLGFFPLLTDEGLLGKFMVYFDSPHVFTPAEVRLAEAIGSHIALQIARRRAQDESARQTALLKAQSELATEGILVVSSEGRILSFNAAFAELWGLSADVLARGTSADALQAVRDKVADPDGFLARVAYLYAHPEEPARDEIALRDGRVLDRHSSPIRGADGAVYGRVWFFHDVTESRRLEVHAAFLAEASGLLGSSLDFRATLQRLADLVVASVAVGCSIEVAAAGAAPEQVALAGELQPPAGGSVLRLPLIAREHMLGTLTLVDAPGHTYESAELELVRDLAGRAALAADNGLLHEAERRARDIAERLQTVSEVLGHAVTQHEIADVVVREGAAALGAAAGWIAHVDLDRRELRRLAAVGYQEHLEDRYSVLPLDRSNVTVDAMLEERARWFASADEVVAGNPALEVDYREAGFEAMAIVPVLVAGRATGVIALNFVEAKAFRDDEKALLTALAAQCGLALERAALNATLQERADAASVLAHVGDGVFRLDRSDRITLWNRGAEVLTGISQEEALGFRIQELFGGWEELHPRIAVTDVPLAFGRREAVPAAISGRERWLAISGVETGDGVVYAFRDVTDAERLEKARRDFLATLSHELRTPLAAVFGATKTLLHRELDAAMTTTLLRVIDSESERLGRILDDILAASRLDHGAVELETTSCDVVELTQGLIELERARTPDGTVLLLDEHGEIPAVACDPVKLRQVLLNLIDNAIKYSPDGGTVRVTLVPDGDVVRISVADEGLGIPADEQERIFEKFYRLDPDLSRGVGGTGLGLYISRELITRMHGRLSVGSEQGRGSVFTVEIPVAHR
jgi:PAS domain S-box-containing protein